MKPIKKIKWACGYCEYEYDTKEEAKDCSKNERAFIKKVARLSIGDIIHIVGYKAEVEAIYNSPFYLTHGCDFAIHFRVLIYNPDAKEKWLYDVAACTDGQKTKLRIPKKKEKDV